ncbi:hypothetical protein D3C75_689090 [compost metagenome]
MGPGQPEHHQTPTGRRDLHPWHAERVVGHVLRRQARSGVPADWQRDARLLRRPTYRVRRQVELVHRRYRCEDRPGTLALPDHSPRPVGLRPAGTATAVRRAGRQGRHPASPGASHQAGRDLPAKPRNRRAYRPRRRAPGAARQGSRRTLLANPAVLGGHAVNRQQDPDRIRHVGRHAV